MAKRTCSPKASRWILEVSQDITRLRLARKLTQEQAAERAGIHLRHWQKIETAERPDICLSTLWRIAKAFGLHPSEIVSTDATSRPSAGI